MFYNIEQNYSCEQSYAHAEMAKDGKLICQALTFAAVLSTYACNPVTSTPNRVCGRKAPHLVQWEKVNSQEQSFGILESLLFSYIAMKKIISWLHKKKSQQFLHIHLWTYTLFSSKAKLNFSFPSNIFTKEHGLQKYKETQRKKYV